MQFLTRRAYAGSLLCVLVALGGCGDDAKRPVRDGGTLTVLSGSDVDFLDPGHTVFAQGMQVAAATQRPLFGYRPGDPSTIVPDMAAASPVVSDGGRTITVRLRRGVRFSPPVSREVRSQDVAYALERFFSVNVSGPYMGYFSDLVGAPSAPTRGVKPIRGITTPDDHTIVFRLRAATSASFIGALTMPASAAVPEDYARPFDAKNPSTYNTHVVATGPYMVRNDAAGRTVGYQAGRLIELVRNPNWRASTDRRPAHLNAIRIRTNASDATVTSRQVLTGSHVVYAVPPPGSVLKELSKGRWSGQAVRAPSGDFRFVPINTTIKPFDRLDVRKAILAVFDRDATRQARGGAASGPIATHFLAPGIPGHDEAGGARGSGADYLANEDGDLALAKRYMQRAGYASGSYTGDEEFLVVGGNTVTERNVAEVVKAQYEKLGFKIRLRIVPDDALFTNWCSVPAKKVLSCSGIAWLRDFSDPEPMLKPVFAGSAIAKPSGNTNFSQLDDPAINTAMAKARLLAGQARATAWGQIDTMIVGQAAAIPLQWDDFTLIQAKDVNGVASTTFGSFDLSYTALK
ncbi:ABC transporter substrate-binding protein [Baekduia sp. Peel2402]|uniref:ABC transporter substrate-binding protein n=1 Tax=Baekduia sp. Peel2402 TaxID=3458296 RepID=UPI00403EB637